MASSDSSRELGVPPNVWRVTTDTADLTREPLKIRPITFQTDTKTSVSADLNKTACLVIDMQNDFCHDEGWLSSVVGVDVTPLKAPISPLNKLLPALREHCVPIVWVNWGNRADLCNISPALRHVYKPSGTECGLGDPLPTRNAPVLQKDSWAAAIVDELVQDPRDVHVDKYRMSGFWDTPLDSILRNLNRTTLLFAGVNADQCVMCTLQDANFLGYDTILLRDCTATSSPDYCMQATIYNVNQCFGFVTDSNKIVEALRASER
jgi:nicotinamidase-related amidase